MIYEFNDIFYRQDVSLSIFYYLSLNDIKQFLLSCKSSHTIWNLYKYRISFNVTFRRTYWSNISKLDIYYVMDKIFSTFPNIKILSVEELIGESADNTTAVPIDCLNIILTFQQLADTLQSLQVSVDFWDGNKFDLKRFKKLKYLDISKSLIPMDGAEYIYKGIAALTNLETLCLANTLYTNEHMSYLSGIKSLTALDLSYCFGRFTGSGFQYLATLSNLKSLIVKGDKTDFVYCPNGFIQISMLTNLTLLDVSDSSFSCPQLFSTLPNLNSLNLSDCSNLLHQQFVDLSQWAPNLTNLNVSNTSFRNQNLLCCASTLTHLNVSKCMLSSFEAYSVENLFELQSLNLSYTNIDDSFLRLVANTLKKLTYLDVTGCPNISKSELDSLKSYDNLKIIKTKN
jgi:hypothetical protein